MSARAQLDSYLLNIMTDVIPNRRAEAVRNPFFLRYAPLDVQGGVAQARHCFR
jgi:hypothetical protein